MSTKDESLTKEQALMQQVVHLIADKYTPSQTDTLIQNAEKITKAILHFNSDR